MPRVVLLLALLPLGPSPLRAQALVDLGGAVAQADLLYLADDLEGAYALLLGHVETVPRDYAALWRVARAGVMLGLYEEEENRTQNGYLDPALHYARIAVELRPDAVEARYWRGAAAGLRSLNAKGGYASELAQLTYEDAHAILATDSLHAGAHNLLGRLNYEFMALSRIQRLIARLFVGNEALEQTSWERAEAHLARAVEVAPDHAIYHLDLARLYERRGREEEAADHLERAAELPPIFPIDERVRAQARALLEEISPQALRLSRPTGR